MMWSEHFKMGHVTQTMEWIAIPILDMPTYVAIEFEDCVVQRLYR